MSTPGHVAWRLATLALDLLAVDPGGLGGLSIKARAGPVRDTFLAALTRLPAPTLRVHPAMPREALFGGLDLAATLSSGRIVDTAGVLAGGTIPVLAMAERCPSDRAAELAAWMGQTDTPLIALDEGADPGETAPPALLERMAFQVSLDGIGRLEAQPPVTRDIATARDRLENVITPREVSLTLTALAARLGIDSLRAPLLALKAARAHAALENRDKIGEIDVEIAATLVLAPRATVLPEPEDESAEDTPPEPQDQSSGDSDGETPKTPDDILVDAIRPHLPDDLLEILAARKSRLAKGTGAGQARKSNRRGRPLPSRPGKLGQGARVDLVGTLRTAAPWQVLRKRGDGPVKVQPSDIRVKRYEEKSDRLLIFAVDASGSAAMARLAEAKGAVEILLSQAYASRDHVALVAFRGSGADLLLPPTRSLVQTKRRLQALPGGGGTPLAAGLKVAGELALHARAQGLSPTLALLTDGRANIALDGTANRAQAGLDANTMASWLRSEGVPSIVLDTSMRPDKALVQLSKSLSATYLPLPRADARQMGQALSHGLDA